MDSVQFGANLDSFLGLFFLLDPSSDVPPDTTKYSGSRVDGVLLGKLNSLQFGLHGDGRSPLEGS